MLNFFCREFPFLADYESVECGLNNRRGDRPDSQLILPLSQVRPDEFICSYETHCFALCMCCDFFACDCRMKCSDGCSCFHDQTWASNVIQCGGQMHPVVPEFIPMDATAVYLDGNNLTDLSTETFVGRKHLTSLYLNNSFITDLSNKTLSGLSELLVLHLDRNRLTTLNGGEFVDLISLVELHLDRNSITFIHRDTFSTLENLRVLTLDRNQLSAFPLWSLFINAGLTSLTLSGNPWSCDCAYLHQAQKFIQDRKKVIEDVGKLQCVVKESRAWNAIGNASCADVMAVSFRAQDEGDDEEQQQQQQQQHQQHDSGVIVGVNNGESSSTFGLNLLPIVAIVSSSLIIVLSVIILAFAFRKPVSLW